MPTPAQRARTATGSLHAAARRRGAAAPGRRRAVAPPSGPSWRAVRPLGPRPPAGARRATPVAPAGWTCSAPARQSCAGRRAGPGPRRRRRTRPRRVVLLVDVSGSMAPYADGCCGSRHAASGRRPRLEVFTVGTRLTRVTRELRLRDPERALRPAGECAGLVGRHPAGRGAEGVPRPVGPARDGAARWWWSAPTAGSAATPALLGEQMARLARLAHRVVWVNPHRGKDGFAPVRPGWWRRCRTSTRWSPVTASRRSRSCGGGRRCVTCWTAAWWDAGEPVGMATVVATSSAPRQPGAAMLVGPDGTAVGSVSGGCVEGAVYELARRSSPRRAGAAAVRRQRRRRVRGRADLRRHHRLFVERVDRRRSRSSARSPTIPPAGRWRW